MSDTEKKEIDMKDEGINETTMMKAMNALEIAVGRIYEANDRSVRIPADTRSPIPVISVQSVGDLQYRRQS